MRETEVEEGEARCGENDANIDPDTALSYIDTRIQHALGHFQKDFEGEVSAETLGPRFGGYGSFLPAYKLPPTVQSHGKAVNPNKTISPNSYLFEGAPKPSAPTRRDLFVDQNVASADDMASKDASLSHGERCFSEKESATSNLVNPAEQRSLKVRIKVGYDKPAMKLDEIYGGLGLLTPSPSTGNNSEDSGGQVPFDSPSGILRDMTATFVPENRLLSPLNESLIRLQFKVMPIIGEKTSSSVVNGSSSVPGEVKSAGFKVDKGPVLEKRMKTESVDYKQGLISDLKVKPSSDSRVPEANRAAKKDVPIKKRETKKELMNDLFFGSDSTSKESIECYEPKNVKKPSPDSKRIVQDDHKNVSDVIKHEINKTIKCEQQEVKVPKNIEKPPSERKKKLKGIQTKENSRSSLSGAMKDKKDALKDIVKVRNSYKDILDTGNGALEENLERDGIPAEVAVPQLPQPPQQTEMGPAVPPDNWVWCDHCQKWRLLPIGIEPDSLPDKWLCSMSTWLPGRNHCDISEDETTRAVQEMNLQLISQSSLQHNGSRGNIGNSDQTNANLIETSHSSMDAQQLGRQKRKRLIETTEPLLERNDFVKAKKIKSNKQSEDGLVISNKIKNESEQLCFGNGDHQAKDSLVTSNKIKNESEQLCASNRDHRAKNSLVISVKRHTENTPMPMKCELLEKKVEIHGKKRKLKDWQESQPYANALESSEDRIGMKDKRLKTEVKHNKVRTMKIKLSASKENLVNTSQEKSQQHEEKINGTATASSSKISGSSRRVTLQERKGSPVGSVSSSSIRALDLNNISPAAGKTISRKAHVKPEIPRKDIDASQSQRSDGKVDVKHKEASKIKNCHVMEHATGQSDVRMNKKVDASGANELTSQPLTGQPNEMRRVSNDVKIAGKKRAGPEATLGDTDSPKMKPTGKDSQKVFPTEKSNLKNSNEVEPKVEMQAVDGPGQTQSKVLKQPGDAATQNTMKNLSVISFLKEYSSGQTALTPFKRAEESKDYADRIKTSGFDYECNDAYFDSALKFLYAASLLETCTADISKSKGVDPINGYTNSAKLSKMCAHEYEKRKEAAAAALAYKCMEVAYMRIVYCKSLLTRQDLQTSMQMVTQSESPSSSASDVDNLNNQVTMDKTMLSKNISHPGNQVVVRNQANFVRLLDLTSDVSLAMEASTKSQNAYKAVVQQSQNNETITSVKRVIDFSFQDVKELVFLIQNTREAINRQGFKGNNRR